jgi:hypothetical protein
MTRPLLYISICAALAAAACSDSTSANDVAGDEPELKSAEASLVVPLIDEKKKLLSRFNAQAKAKGLKEIPDTVEVKTAADAQKIADLRSYFDETIMPAVGAKDQSMPAWGPDSFTNWSKTNKTPGLCYRGNPTKIVDLMSSKMPDTVLSDQLMIHGWRYKAEKHFGDGDEEFEDQFPDMWKEWRGSGTAVLVVASIGDGGDDLSPAIIPRCK